MTCVRHLLLLAALLLAASAHAADDYSRDPFSPKVAREAWNMIGRAEAEHGIPIGLLHAMSLTETGQGVAGWMLPWPYTVCINSTGQKSYIKQQHALTDLNWMRSLGFVRYDVTVGGQSLSNAKTAAVQALISANPAATSIRLKPRPFSRRFSNADDATAYVYGMFAKGHKNMDLGLMQINWRVHGSKLGSVQNAFNPRANLDYAVNYLLEHRATRDWWGSVGRYHSGTAYYANKYIRNVYTWYKRVHDYNSGKQIAAR
ncbi:MAG: transglycosylase SLT domain-containing protein [Pseudomonadaceae bacterium]|nr:transglycosylase SLT domain-containing protein [Pseudomonadaceae bacterium]